MVFVRPDGQGHGRVVAALARGAVAVMLLSGCQGDAEPTPMATASGGQPSASATTTGEGPSALPTAAATIQPSPASSAGPAANLPVPVKPALADENTAEGLEAFTKYWFELFSYGYETNDWAAFDEVTDSGCMTCENLTDEVRGLYSDGGWIEGGQVRLNSFDTSFEQNTSGSVNAFVDVQQEELVYFDSSGIEIDRSDALPSTVNVSIALWDQGRWLMLDFGSPEGS